MYEDWKQALKLEGEKNDKEDGSGVLFNIVVIGNRDTGPPQEGIKFEAMGGTKMATPRKNVSGGRLRGKARKEARLREASQATASSACIKPTEDEVGRPYDRAEVETQGSEAM